VQLQHSVLSGIKEEYGRGYDSSRTRLKGEHRVNNRDITNRDITNRTGKTVQHKAKLVKNVHGFISESSIKGPFKSKTSQQEITDDSKLLNRVQTRMSLGKIQQKMTKRRPLSPLPAAGESTGQAMTTDSPKRGLQSMLSKHRLSKANITLSGISGLGGVASIAAGVASIAADAILKKRGRKRVCT